MVKVEATIKKDARGNWLILSNNGVTFPIQFGEADVDTVRALVKSAAVFTRGSSQKKQVRV